MIAIAADITDQSQVNAAIKQVLDVHGRVDVLINNAGVIQVGPMETTTLEDYKQSMNVHYWGPVYTIMAVLPHMKEKRRGRIINVCSIGGKVSVPHLLPYSGSKFALVGFSEGLRAELLKDRIFVTTVSPGLMRTGSHFNAYFKGQNRAEFAWFSVSNALPLFSTSAVSAAEQIYKACKFGDPELIITPQAQILAKLQGVVPGLFDDALSLVNMLLPAPGGIGSNSALGSESTSKISPSVYTLLADKAAIRNNELK